MISHRILGCLFLILLTQYSDASRSRYVESILNSLQRIEKRIENLKVFQETKQAEQSTLNCLVPAEKIFNLISELSKIPNNDTNETQITRRNVAPLDSNSIRILRTALGLDDDKDIEPPFKPFRPVTQRTKDKNRNENKNANINTNTNFNANHFNVRRTLDDISHLNKGHNQNVNTNYNVNTNLNKHRNIMDLLDFSDEEEA
ncbi:hypothetical protein ACS0PU_002158 [Formica fusca]